MNRLKSTLATIAAAVFGLIALGFFASVGLAVIGLLAALAAIGALAVGVQSLIGTRGPVPAP